MNIAKTLEPFIRTKRMDAFETKAAPAKSRIWRFLFVVIVLGLAVNLLLPQISDLRESWAVVQHLTWWAVGLAVLAEVFAYLALGYCLHAIVALHKRKLSIPKGALISLAAMSTGLVAGGWFAIAGSTIGSVKRHTEDGNTATMAGLLPSMLVNLSIEIIAVGGMVYLLLLDKLTQSQLIQYLVFILLLTLITFGSLVALYFPKAAYRAVNWVLWKWARLRKKPYDPRSTHRMVNDFIMSWKALAKGRWPKPFLGAFCYVLFDMLTLYFLFIAAGHSVNLGVILAGYGLPFLISKIAFIFPGGLGVIETSMAAIFSTLGVPSEVSVVVILSFRLFTFWLPVLLGFVSVGYLSRHNGPANGQA